LIPWWGNSLRKTGTERETGWAVQESLLLVSLSREFPPEGTSRRAPDTHGCPLGMPLLDWCSSDIDLGPEEMSLCGHKMLHAGLKCFRLVSRVLAFTGQRTGSWGSWLTCEPKPVHAVGFIRKERLQLEQCSRMWKPVTHCSGEGWGFYEHFNSGFG
jgi:hypothetical protein